VVSVIRIGYRARVFTTSPNGKKTKEKDVKDMSTHRPEHGPARGHRIQPEMLEAFERELTPDVARRLLELAMRRTAMMRAAGIPATTDEAKLLVQDAITETLASVAYWQPGEDPLSLHLRGVVRRSSWARLEQARRHAALAAAAEPRDATSHGADLSTCPRRGALQVMQQVIEGLSARSPDDAAIRLLLEAYCAGSATRAEVLAHTGLSEEEYVAARRRLDRLLAALPEPPSASEESVSWRPQ
jgi:hypothetical protein